MNPYYQTIFANGKNGDAVRVSRAISPVWEDAPEQPRMTQQTGMQPTAPQMAAPMSINPPTAALPPARADIYSYPQNLKDALDMLENAIRGEAQDRVFSLFLVNAAPKARDRTIIQGMIEDEMEHFKIFREIYTNLSGREAPSPNPRNIVQGTYTYCEGLQMALMADDQDIIDYGKILFALQDRRMINMMTKVLLDEIRHTNLFNYMYSSNMCPSQSNIQY